VSADNGFHARRGQSHGLGYRRQIGMPGEHQFCVAASSAKSGGRKAALGALATSENKFAAAYGHAVKFRRVIEAEETAFHGAAGGKLREDGGDVAAGALNAAWGVQFRKYADEHWVSLPSAAMERKRESREIMNAWR
jgi:hypothetical protein